MCICICICICMFLYFQWLRLFASFTDTVVICWGEDDTTRRPLITHTSPRPIILFFVFLSICISYLYLCICLMNNCEVLFVICVEGEDDTTQLVLSHLPSWPDRRKSPRLHMTLVWFGKNTSCLPLEKGLKIHKGRGKNSTCLHWFMCGSTKKFHSKMFGPYA